MAANVTITLSDTTILANSTTDVINVSTTTSNVILSNTIAKANFASYAGQVLGNAQPNITSVGTLTSLNVSGNAFINGTVTGIDSLTVSGDIISLNGNANVENVIAKEGQLWLNPPAPNISTNAYIIVDGLDGADYPLIEWNNTAQQSWTIGKGRPNLLPKNQGGFSWYESNDTLQANTIEGATLNLSGNVNSGPLYVTGDSTIVGNLEVQGNIDYVNVEDLLVNDQSITLNYGNATPRDAFIYIDRSGGALNNVALKWNETDDKWQFTNDGVTYNNILGGLVDDTSPQLGANLDVNGYNILFESGEKIVFEGGYGDNTGANIDGNTTTLNIWSGANTSIKSFANANIDFAVNTSSDSFFKLTAGAGLREYLSAFWNGGITLGSRVDTNIYVPVDIFNKRIAVNGPIDFANSQVTGTFASNSNITTTANVEGAYILGDGSQLSNLPGGISNADAKAYIEANGLDATANLTTTANVQGSWFVGNVDGQVNDISNFTTTDLTEGTNLYYTNARANAAFTDSLDNIATDIISTANITTTANVQGSWFVGNVDATTIDVVNMNVTGNILTDGNIDGNLYVGGTVFATAFDGDGSDLTSVRAETLEEKVINKSGGLLPKGTPVFATGNVTADALWVNACDASNAATMPCIGVLATDLANDVEGRAIISGKIAGVDTSSFSPGDEIYVAPGGGYTNSHPSGEANIIQFLGIVTESSNTGGGIVNIESPHDESNLDEGNIFLGDTNNMTRSVTPDTNFDTTGNTFSLSNSLTDVNKVTSESATAMTLYAQNGVELNRTVDSTESRIVDIDTTGYSIAEATTPADFTVGNHVPGFYTVANVISGSNTFTTSSPILNSFVPALRGPTYAVGIVTFAQTLEAAVTTAGNDVGSGANGLYNPAAGLYGQKYGWTIYDTVGASFTTLFPANAYVTNISGSTVTMSENAIASQNGAVIFTPGMASSTQSNALLKYFDSKIAGANVEPIGIYGKLSTFEFPETLSNVTFDLVSYGNTSSVTMSSVSMKNISDFTGSDESATRFKRGLLIGPSATPDPVSGRSTASSPSALGVILENDGETFTGNNAPAAKFLINSYSGNLDDLTEYPTWATLGITGNLSLDLPQLKAPQLQLKSFRGAKSNTDPTTFKLEAGDVVGKIAFSPAQTDGTGYQGADFYNPPAAITVDVGDANVTYVANTYMHITTTPDPGTNLGYMRNNANVNSGANQQTNFTTKDGNVTIAAQTNGMISLAPTPDYGDGANSTVWTRYPGSTHEYHRFMDVGFDDKANKVGTLVVVQPQSGQTTGSGGLSYDSKGDATLRLATQFSNTAAHYHWDISHNESAETLDINYPTGTAFTVSETEVEFTSIPKLPQYSNTSLPTSVTGGMIYVTNGNDKPAYGDGTNWYYYDGTQVT